jgi:magnesium chelatase subunit ChlD-like protein
LAQADRLLQRSARAAPGQACGRPVERWLWLLSDGRTLDQPQAPRAAQQLVIVDFDDPHKPLGRCAAWAARWGAAHQRPAGALPPFRQAFLP